MKNILPFIYLLLLLASKGQAQQLLYERNYKVHPNSTEICASSPDGKGNVLFSGTAFKNLNVFDHYFLMVKPDADTLWTRKGAHQVYYPTQTLRSLPGGGFIFGGNIKSGGSPASITLQKLDTNGFPVSTYNLTSPPSSISSMLVMPDKGYLLGGGYGFGSSFAFIRTDSSGNVKWNKSYRWSAINDGIVDMTFNAAGNIVAAGITAHPIGPIHTKLLEINHNGDSLKGKQLLIKSLNGVEGMYANYNSITPLSDGGYLLTTNTDTTVTPPYSENMGMVTKVDSSFNLVWNYVHRTPNTEEYLFSKARELADGSLLVLGARLRPTTSNSFQLYRFSPFGQLLKAYPFYSSICTQVYGVTLDVLNDSTFMVGGRCGNNPPITYGMYVATVKIPGLPPVLPLIQPNVTATKPELSWQLPALGQSYPNPAQHQALIPYNLPNGTKSAKILLRDITGRQVGSYSLKVNQKQGSLPVNLSSFRNGLYLYSLVLDGKPVATKKLVVVR